MMLLPLYRSLFCPFSFCPFTLFFYFLLFFLLHFTSASGRMLPYFDHMCILILLSFFHYSQAAAHGFLARVVVCSGHTVYPILPRGLLLDFLSLTFSFSLPFCASAFFLSHSLPPSFFFPSPFSAHSFFCLCSFCPLSLTPLSLPIPPRPCSSVLHFQWRCRWRCHWWIVLSSRRMTLGAGEACYACPSSPDWSVPALPASGLEAKIVPYPVDRLWRFLIGYCS